MKTVAATGVVVCGLIAPNSRSAASGQDRSRAEVKTSRAFWITIAITALKMAIAMPRPTSRLTVALERSSRNRLIGAWAPSSHR